MTKQLPTPSPSPPPAVETPTLPSEINAATRKQHTKLNRLIVDRLPLALPPNQSGPALLGQGLATFAGIFFTFESVWQELVLSTKNDDGHSESHSAAVLQWLCDLRPVGLSRTQRLEDDLSHISQRSRGATATSSNAQQQMLQKMANSIRSRPHILIAYAWVMYMAVFSGGRWIRQQLASAGVEFWTGKPEYMQLDKDYTSLVELPGFTFLSFDGKQDGEDLKMLFKARLAEAESLLTQQEREEVISAAQALFDDCIALVDFIDQAVWWKTVRSMILMVSVFAMGPLIGLLCYYGSTFGNVHTALR